MGILRHWIGPPSFPIILLFMTSQCFCAQMSISNSSSYGGGQSQNGKNTEHEVYRVYRIYTRSWADVRAVQKLHEIAQENPEIDFWLESAHPGQFADVMIAPEGNTLFEHFLADHPALHVIMTVEDVQKLIWHNELNNAPGQQQWRNGQEQQRKKKREEQAEGEEEAFYRSIRRDQPLVPSAAGSNGGAFYAFDQIGQLRGASYPWGEYTGYSAMVRYMRTLEFYYPHMVQLVQLGTTHEGRSIEGVRIGHNVGAAAAANTAHQTKIGRKKRVFWIDGNMHAREWASGHTALFIINQLVWAYGKDPFLTNALNHIDFVIVPCTNPDGFEYSRSSLKPQIRLWRKNRSPEQCTRTVWGGLHCCRGVDLNRNFDFHWAETGSSSNACSNLFAGKKVFSEPEARAIADYLGDEELKGRVDAFITLHTYAQLWIHPFSHEYQTYSADVAKLKNLALKATQRLREVYGTEYRIGTGADLLAPASGGSDDWAKDKLGAKFVYLVELRPQLRISNGFILRQEELLPTAIETFEAIKVVIQGVLVENSLPLVPLPAIRDLLNNIANNNHFRANFSTTIPLHTTAPTIVTAVPETVSASPPSSSSQVVLATTTPTTTSTTTETTTTPSTTEEATTKTTATRETTTTTTARTRIAPARITRPTTATITEEEETTTTDRTTSSVRLMTTIKSTTRLHPTPITMRSPSTQLTTRPTTTHQSIKETVTSTRMTRKPKWRSSTTVVSSSEDSAEEEEGKKRTLVSGGDEEEEGRPKLEVVEVEEGRGKKGKKKKKEDEEEEEEEEEDGDDEGKKKKAKGEKDDGEEESSEEDEEEVKGKKRKGTTMMTTRKKTTTEATNVVTVLETGNKGEFFIKLPSGDADEQPMTTPGTAGTPHSVQFRFTVPPEVVKTTEASRGELMRRKQFMRIQSLIDGMGQGRVTVATTTTTTGSTMELSAKTAEPEMGTRTPPQDSGARTTTTVMDSGVEQASRATQIIDEIEPPPTPVVGSTAPPATPMPWLPRVVSSLRLLNSDRFTEFEVHRRDREGRMEELTGTGRRGRTLADYWKSLFGGEREEDKKREQGQQQRETGTTGKNRGQEQQQMTGTTTTTMAASGKCRDERSSCAFWIRAHPTVCTDQMRYMRRNCALSCGFCGGTNKRRVVK